MRAPLATALLLFLAAPPVVAEGGRAESALHKGATSLEIGVDTFSGSYASTAEIAARRHVSPAWAVRLSASVATDDGHEDRYDLQDDIVYPSRGESNANNWGLGAQALWFPVRDDEFALLFALGPKYTRSHAERTGTEYSNGSVTRVDLADESSAHALGLELHLGFEWFVSKRIALHAKTGATFSHFEREDGSLRIHYDVNGTVVQRFGNARTSEGSSFDTLGFGLRLVGYF